MTLEVSQKDPLYQTVKKRFEASGMRLTKMAKVERSSDVELFEQEKMIMLEHLKMKVGDDTSKVDDLRVLDLYHGTSESSEQILNEGLDVRTLKHFGHFGRGIYFSDDPAFARVEAESSGSSKVIYRCKVILGNSKVYPPGVTDPSLTREPRELVEGKKVAYDSVEGNISGFAQFAVYERRRILIQHVLGYEADGPPPTLLPLPERLGKSDATGDQSASSNDDNSSGSSDDSSFHTPEEDEGGLVERRKKRKRKVMTDPNGVIRSALNHLMSLRGLQSKEVFDELLLLFHRTYIQWPENSRRSKVTVENDSKNRKRIEDFCSTTGCTDEVEAKIFLAVNNNDMNEAVLNYITMVK